MVQLEDKVQPGMDVKRTEARLHPTKINARLTLLIPGHARQLLYASWLRAHMTENT